VAQLVTHSGFGFATLRGAVVGLAARGPELEPLELSPSADGFAVVCSTYGKPSAELELRSAPVLLLMYDLFAIRSLSRC
jgi:hypothetical protein